MLTRRFLLGGGAVGLAAWVGGRPFWAGAAVAAQFPVMHSDAEWHQLLTPAQYAVLRQSDTERPFTSPLLNEHRSGIFACAGCTNELFSSETKFESGTGWPSFWAPLKKEGSIGTTGDTTFGMVRSAVHCATCGGHLGHVFDDGPRPTGLRYCMNGVAMVFKPGPAAHVEAIDHHVTHRS
ncbi:MAG TPA: peptide-methionine (R)-S-oxide reductase MsrB [Stellaceae bacterium]|jgi:peptide-methionine (R)-S-oxide reductase|nr:peptide-methionine (R)-S-oxide reductase MsrB [Stellaceae bacterium]